MKKNIIIIALLAIICLGFTPLNTNPLIWDAFWIGYEKGTVNGIKNVNSLAKNNSKSYIKQAKQDSIEFSNDLKLLEGFINQDRY